MRPTFAAPVPYSGSRAEPGPATDGPCEFPCTMSQLDGLANLLGEAEAELRGVAELMGIGSPARPDKPAEPTTVPARLEAAVRRAADLAALGRELRRVLVG